MPEHKLALGMMTNGDKGPTLYDRFNKAILREFCGIEIAEPRAIESSVEELAQYVGVTRARCGKSICGWMRGDCWPIFRYHGDFPSDMESTEMAPAEVARCGDDQLLILAGAHKDTRADFIRDAKNEIRYLRFGSRLNPRRD